MGSNGDEISTTLPVRREVRRRRSGGLTRAAAAGILAIALLVATIGVSGMAHGGGGVKCGCGCLQCGPCPTDTELSMDSSVVTNSTNSTILWWLTTSSPMNTAEANITFGNTTAYLFFGTTNQFGGEIPTAVFLNYLNPSTTYYYKVVGWTSCSSTNGNFVYHDTITGSWNTKSDTSFYINGTLSNAQGADAPGNIYLTADCANPAHSGSWTGWALTNSHGAYSFQTVNQVGMPDPNPCFEKGWGINVTVVNSAANMWNSLGVIWTGVWNETFLIFAPQTVDPVLPMNFVTGPID
jgi:hypothetical protein